MAKLEKICSAICIKPGVLVIRSIVNNSNQQILLISSVSNSNELDVFSSSDKSGFFAGSTYSFEARGNLRLVPNLLSSMSLRSIWFSKSRAYAKENGNMLHTYNICIGDVDNFFNQLDAENKINTSFLRSSQLAPVDC